MISIKIIANADDSNKLFCNCCSVMLQL